MHACACWSSVTAVLCAVLLPYALHHVVQVGFRRAVLIHSGVGRSCVTAVLQIACMGTAAVICAAMLYVAARCAARCAATAGWLCACVVGGEDARETGEVAIHLHPHAAKEGAVAKQRGGPAEGLGRPA